MYAFNLDALFDPDLSESIWNILEIGILFILAFFGAYFIRRYIKKRAINKIQARFNLGYGLFFIIQSINQVFYLLSSVSNGSTFLVPEIHDYLVREAPILLFGMDKPLFRLDFQIYFMFIFFQLSFLLILFPTEKYLRNSKKYPVSALLVLSIVFLTFILTLGHFIPSDFASIPDTMKPALGIIHPILMIEILLTFALSMVVAVVFYIIIGVKTTGELRRKSFFTAFGFIIWFMSVIVGNVIKPYLDGFLILIGPMMFYCGTFMLVYSFVRKD
jgi:hypothetical protein